MDEVEEVKNKTSKKKRWVVVLDIFILIIGVVALAVAGVLVYQKVYLTPFWVNGQSMYPAFNKDALTRDGRLAGKTGGASGDGATKIDFIVIDEHQRAINNLKRFDVVVSKYSEDDATKKIKRVIGLPGETIRFTAKPGFPDNGDLYVKENDTYTLVKQPIENSYKAEPRNYPVGDIVLGDDEYYLLGDNRAHSSDSREKTVGKIKKSWIIGKVVAICGYCDLQVVDGQLVPVKVHYTWPRFDL